MARVDTVGATPASDPDCPVEHDVLVVGGGAAGLSAAVFLARYGLDTLVLARGKSAIRQCALVENYLGFPGGVTPERFLALGRDQAELEGATVREELVERVEPVELDGAAPDDDAGLDDGDALDGAAGGFRVESDGSEYAVGYVLAATAYDGDMFGPVEDDLDTDAEHGKLATADGRTSVDGLYAAGWMTDETVHQAIVSAGHGARAAIALIRDDLAARYWPAVAEQYVDWVVHEGRYGGEGWAEHTREWFDRDVRPDDGEVDPELADAALEHLRSEFLARELSAEELDRRDRAGQRRLLEHLDDEVVLERAAEIESDRTTPAADDP